MAAIIIIIIITAAGHKSVISSKRMASAGTVTAASIRTTFLSAEAAGTVWRYVCLFLQALLVRVPDVVFVLQLCLHIILLK